MSQSVIYWIEGEQCARELPCANETVLPGMAWGEFWNLFTPAYWVSQLWMSGLDAHATSPYQAQGSLAEEVTFCLLGGFGITAELATAAFQTCRSAGLIEELNVSTQDWSEVLRRPMKVGDKTVRYRYPNQKAIYLAGAMDFLRRDAIDMSSGRALRDSLLGIRGVGPKTAGWVARNILDSDDVAILDIHIVRAGQLCDLYKPDQKVEREYFDMEARYIDFCRALETRPAVLDCLIWDQMRTLGSVAIDALRHKTGECLPPAAKPLDGRQYSMAF